MTGFSVPRSQIRHRCRICLAAAAGVPVILNPSPLTPEFIQARVEADTLILNAHEVDALVSMTPAEIEAEPQRARTAAHCRQMIITRGGDPTLVITASGILKIAPPSVTPVDTVGAGDAFTGAFADASASGVLVEEAIRFANLRGHWRRRVGECSLQSRNAMRSLRSWAAKRGHGVMLGAVERLE